MGLMRRPGASPFATPAPSNTNYVRSLMSGQPETPFSERVSDYRQSDMVLQPNPTWDAPRARFAGEEPR